MSEDSDHWSLHVAAVELWGSGELVEARRKFEHAIEVCPATHWALGQYRGAYAGVLAALGLLEEAGVQRELALEHELADGEGDDAPSVAVARYFLGLHRTQVGDFQGALDVVTPSLRRAAKFDSVLGSVQAQALAGLGRIVEARAAAMAAIASAQTDAQRSKVTDELAHLLEERA
jgi:tetratricopeptide (TPR) repeat protein